MNVQPDGTFHQFLLSQNLIDCVEYGTHYTYVLDDGFLLPGTHVLGRVHASDGTTSSDGHWYEQNLFVWSTGTCGVQPSGPNGFDLMVVPNGSGGILVASETDDDQNPVWIKNVPAPALSGDGTEIHLTSASSREGIAVFADDQPA